MVHPEAARHEQLERVGVFPGAEGARKFKESVSRTPIQPFDQRVNAVQDEEHLRTTSSTKKAIHVKGRSHRPRDSADGPLVTVK